MGPGSAERHFAPHRVRDTRSVFYNTSNLIQRNALLHHCA